MWTTILIPALDPHTTEMRLSTAFILTLVPLLGAVNTADAQALFRRRTWIPRELVGGQEKGIPNTVMQQQCDYELSGETRRYREGEVIQRVVTVTPRLTVIVTDTLTARDTTSVPIGFAGAKKSVDVSRNGLEGEVYVESASPSVLRVRAVGGDSLTATFADPIPGATAKRCNLTFQVRSGTDLGFRSSALVVNAIAIPFRIRPSFSKIKPGSSDTTFVNSEVLTSLSAGVSLTWSRWGTWYSYREGVSSAVRTTNKFGIGPFVAFSTGSADKNTTRTAKEPLSDTQKASFLSVLPGASITFAKFGIDFGLVGGTEHVIGSRQARKWDWNNRLWYGANVGFGFAKWGA